MSSSARIGLGCCHSAPAGAGGGGGLLEDQDRGRNSDANAASASVVTSLSLGEISLWRNGVMDDEWWVCPSGANAQQSGLLQPERETERRGGQGS